MDVTYRLKANDLTEDFIRSIKAIFNNKEIAITIEEKMDETEYLLSSEANRKMLMESIGQAKKGEIVTVDIGKYAKK